MGRVRTVPRLCVLYPGICLTTEEKARKKTTFRVVVAVIVVVVVVVVIVVVRAGNKVVTVEGYTLKLSW